MSGAVFRTSWDQVEGLNAVRITDTTGIHTFSKGRTMGSIGVIGPATQTAMTDSLCQLKEHGDKVKALRVSSQAT